MLKLLLQQMAEFLDTDDDPHLGDDAHALDQDDYAEETDDLDDDF